MKWVLEELLQKMRNGVKISNMLIISVLLAACGQSGPLYMPGQATGVHKKDVFLLNSDGAEVQTPAVKDNTEDKTKPTANAAETTSTPVTADTTVQAVPTAAAAGTEPSNKPSD